ncbi:LOW QUALITY PROTEIN: activator of 90 kDa heat shock protein ATPase homolog 2-like [Pongo pygmaeus]|uniref:LOW QUALITY PROTEIN: activator of 90 kDa heat shock protein ATPase homolog 2-like n=1 Tax=Pongo pygmaeus TaxID=9600 RepID=UPI0023E0D76E|nr:LOW QUALITY PROTEIN: activator of 90 kDa heat shock protein ATPase homolog 2-like [Pongo pygmaeus]
MGLFGKVLGRREGQRLRRALAKPQRAATWRGLAVRRNPQTGARRGHLTAVSRLHRRLDSQAPATQRPASRRREPRARQHRRPCSGLRPSQVAQAAPSRPSARRRAVEPRPPQPLPAPASPRDPPPRSRPGLPGAPRRGGAGGRAFWQFLGAANAPPRGSAAGNAGFGALGATAFACFPPSPRRRGQVGPGDPRWIVEEREEGTNVNNWHWTERDATSWSKGKFRELLVGIVVENDVGRGEISELKQVEGEASCSSRKGKLIFFYEWNIKLDWKGIVKESGVKHKGLIEIPSLSEENEVSDTEVNVSKKKGDGDILKDLTKTAGTAKVREALGDYLKALKTEFTTGMILPTKAMATQELTVKRKLSENTLQVQASSPVALGVRIPTVALHMMELFDTTVEQLYSIFTVKDLVQKFSKSTAVLEAEKGGKFQMFDGNITGEYLQLLTSKIIMKWRCRNWPEEHYATVALNFVPTLGQTELQLDCKGVPICKEENMKFCWQKQHFEEIKGLLQLTPLNG